MECAADAHSSVALAGLLDAALHALSRQTRRTLEDTTFAAIAGAVLREARIRFPLLDALRVEPNGELCGRELRRRAVAVSSTELRQAVCAVLVELLATLGGLTAEILTPELHAELARVALPDRRVRRESQPPPRAATHGLDRRRLENLCEIDKLFMSTENVEHALAPALAVVARRLPLRSAVLLEAGGPARRIMWSAAPSADQLRTVKQRVAEAYRYLAGDTTDGPLELRPMPWAALAPPREAEHPSRFIVMPLVIGGRAPFGALQLEAERLLDKSDLRYANAIANQLAIALDRDRDRRHDLAICEQARAAVRARERVLAIVSHDLRNPLATILGTTTCLANAERAADGRSIGPGIARIRRSADRMLRLVEDLLDFGSIEAGRLAMRAQPQDAPSMAQEILASFEGVARDKRLHLAVEGDTRLPKVLCDRDRILQVLANLVGNATKVAPPGGRITLRIERREGEIRFAVADDGPGFSAEDASRLFEPYWRSGQARYAGTGLGLAIARGIMIAHGERLWAESTPGQGATFFFTLPAAESVGAVAVP